MDESELSSNEESDSSSTESEAESVSSMKERDASVTDPMTPATSPCPPPAPSSPGGASSLSPVSSPGGATSPPPVSSPGGATSPPPVSSPGRVSSPPPASSPGRVSSPPPASSPNCSSSPPPSSKTTTTNPPESILKRAKRNDGTPSAFVRHGDCPISFDYPKSFDVHPNRSPSSFPLLYGQVDSGLFPRETKNHEDVNPHRDELHHSRYVWTDSRYIHRSPAASSLPGSFQQPYHRRDISDRRAFHNCTRSPYYNPSKNEYIDRRRQRDYSPVDVDRQPKYEYLKKHHSSPQTDRKSIDTRRKRDHDSRVDPPPERTTLQKDAGVEKKTKKVTFSRDKKSLEDTSSSPKYKHLLTFNDKNVNQRPMLRCMTLLPGSSFVLCSQIDGFTLTNGFACYCRDDRLDRTDFLKNVLLILDVGWVICTDRATYNMLTTTIEKLNKYNLLSNINYHIWPQCAMDIGKCPECNRECHRYRASVAATKIFRVNGKTILHEITESK